jgi:uncharacterized protein (DUF1778 family)
MATQPAALERRTEKLDLRISPSAKAKLQAAAAALNQPVSEFVLDSALVQAEIALADRTSFSLSPAKWKAFQAALDAPPRPLPRMRRLLEEPSVFETSAAPARPGKR